MIRNRQASPLASKCPLCAACCLLNAWWRAGLKTPLIAALFLATLTASCGDRQSAVQPKSSAPASEANLTFLTAEFDPSAYAGRRVAFIGLPVHERSKGYGEEAAWIEIGSVRMRAAIHRWPPNLLNRPGLVVGTVTRFSEPVESELVRQEYSGAVYMLIDLRWPTVSFTKADLESSPDLMPGELSLTRDVSIGPGVDRDMVIHVTSKGNGELRLGEVRRRIYDDHDDGVTYRNSMFDIALTDLDDDGYIDMVLSGQLRVTEDGQPTEHPTDSVIEVLMFDQRSGTFRSSLRYGEVEHLLR
jgi:hypothetical protein